MVSTSKKTTEAQKKALARQNAFIAKAAEVGKKRFTLFMNANSIKEFEEIKRRTGKSYGDILDSLVVLKADHAHQLAIAEKAMVVVEAMKVLKAYTKGSPEQKPFIGAYAEAVDELYAFAHNQTI